MSKRKSKIKNNKNIRSSILSYLRGLETKKAISENQITKKLAREYPKGELIRTLYSMATEGILSIISGNKFRLKPNYQPKKPKDEFREEVIGIVDMNKNGNAYVIPEEGNQDIHVVSKNLNHALNKDKVKVAVSKSGKKPEGVITEIIERHKTIFIGVVDKKKHCFVRPDDTSMHVDFFIPDDKSNDLKDGQKVVVEMQYWPKKAKNPFGKVTEVLGKAGDNDVEMKSMLVENGFYLNFSDRTMQEANALTTTIPEEEYKKRRDFRGVTTFTIDPADAKDFDDAISIRPAGKGKWEVGVHIADVSYYVKEGSSLDEDAYKRATSVYLVDRVAPMLPEQLSNVICSLRPEEDKCCFSAVFVIDEKAEVHSRWFGRTIIRSERKLAYEEAQQVIETGEGYYSEELKVLNKMASQLRNKRFRDGSLNFDSKEVKFDLDENGKPIGVSVKQQLDAHRLVEDFMLLANRNVAHFLGKEMNANGKLASIYRIHDEPDAEKLKDFSLFALKFGHRLNLDNPKKIASELNRLLLEIEGKPEEAILQQLAIRTMAKAVYTTENIGHYGLGFEYYTHFTSPIRRYPDVMIHRLLHRVLEKQKLIKKNDLDIICSHCSERERAALDAERSSIKYKMIEFMEDRIGEVFQGVISGIKTWGVYVELPSYNTEGMVRIDDFSDDNYVVDEKNMTIAGSHTGNKYLVGDQIYVRLARVDKFRKTIDFSLSSEEEFLSED